ncbi:MAG: hypothetical protein ACI4ET_04660 [Bilifractor sp.]
MTMGLARVLDKEKDGRRIALALEIVYLCYLSVVVLYEYLFSTMFHIKWPAYLEQTLILTGYAIVLVKILMDDRWKWREILCAGLISAAFYGCWKTVHSLNMIFGLILILASRHISFDRIVKTYLAVEIPAVLVTVYCSLNGYITNLAYFFGYGHRYARAFGSIYRTDFCAQLFFLACGLIWVSRKKIWYLEGCFVLWLAWFSYRYCHARNSAICLLLLGVGALVVQGCRDIRSLRKRHKKAFLQEQKHKKTAAQEETHKKAAERYRDGKHEGRLGRPMMFLACFSTPVFAVVSVLLCRFYNPDIGWMAVLDKLFNNRLSQGKEGFDLYNTRIFGQYVHMAGAGGIRDSGEPYFFLDNSYVNMLLTLGGAVFICIILIFLISSFRAFAGRDYVCIFILAVVAMHCTIEHHMAELAFDMFLLLPLADTGWGKRSRRTGRRKRRQRRRKTKPQLREELQGVPTYNK